MSKVNPVRQLTAECVIAASVCAAAYFFLVDPVRTKLTGLQSQITQASVVPPPTPGAAITPEQALTILKEVQARTSAVESRGAIVKDESALFASLMALASAHNVRVDSLTPIGASASDSPKTKRPAQDTAAPPPPPGVEVAEPPPADIRAEYVMATVSTYSDLIRFVGALQSSTGYTVVKSIKIEPVDDATTDRIRASIETAHLAFDTSRVAVVQQPPGGSK